VLPELSTLLARRTIGERFFPSQAVKEKTPGGLSFFQWIGGFGDLSSMGSFFWEFCRLFQILYFSTKENLIFIEIGWGKKIKKSILGMDSN
jgi:hypothetical protein